MQCAGGINVKLLTDSVSSVYGTRLRTFELEYQRFFHSEGLTHRMLSKNSSSTRAIPVDRAIELVMEKTAMPIHWGENNPGMQSKRVLSDQQLELAKIEWLKLRDSIISHVKIMSDKTGINGHKQWAGRPLEVMSFIKVVLTGTDLENLWYLRDHVDAQPEFRELVRGMQSVSEKSTPTVLKPGQWHLPYIDFIDGKYYSNGIELDLDTAKRVSASCCAQASYRKLDDSIEKADKVFKMLNLDTESNDPKHSSPVEHQATPMDDNSIPFNPNTWEHGITHVRRDGSLWSGNFRNWIQFRQLIPNEAKWG